MGLHTSQWIAIFALAAATLASSSALSPAPFPRLEVHQYFVNTTFALRQFACSLEERACFEKSLLLHEEDGKCYAVGEQGPCAAGEVFHADKEEALRLGGHLRGSCARPCGDAERAPVAATGECLTQAEVEEKICRGDLYLRAAKDAFDEWVCEWTHLFCSLPETPAPGSIHQPTYNGICYPPNIFQARTLDGKNITELKEKPEDHPLLKYFSNETYLEREYPCTEEEKECLKYGRVLAKDGKCYSPGEWSNACESGQPVYLDWNEAMKDGGRLQMECRNPCGNYQQLHIITGKCANFGEMNEICRWEWGLSPHTDAFGRTGCSCSWSMKDAAAAPEIPVDASTPGHCRAPKFSNPARPPVYDETLTLGFSGVQCTEEEHACLLEGRVLAKGACHELRTQGPCADGEELVIDKHALAHARLQPVCKETSCPVGSVFMPLDSRCLTYEQVKSLLCLNEEVTLDEFGGWQCSYDSGRPANFSRITRDAAASTCELPEKYPRVQPVPVAAPNDDDKSGVLDSSASSGPSAAENSV